MPQTLIAFGAMILVMLFSMNQQQASLSHSQDIVNTEFELMANARAKEILQLVGSKPFDARIADGSVSPLSGDEPNVLTTHANFGEGNSFDNCEDIDDFNNMIPDTVYFEVREDVGFDFTVSAEVNYVSADGTVSQTPTWIKEVTLTIDALPGPGGQKYLARPLVIKRQFSPQW